MQPIYPCVWLDDQAEPAAEFYASVFDDVRTIQVQRYRGERVAEVSKKPEGSVVAVLIEINGQRLMLLNGGPVFTPNEAVSLVAPCDDQAELDRVWDALTADGGEPGPCGWLKDRFGLSWQIVPASLNEMSDDSDPERAARVMDAVMGMHKIDEATLRDAYEGRARSPT